MKRTMLAVMVAGVMGFGAARSYAHDEGHGPKLTDQGRQGGVVSPVIDKKDYSKGAKAPVVYKGELVRSEDGTVRVYIYDAQMNPLDAARLAPEAKGVVLGLLFSGGVPASVREQIRHSWDAHVRDLAEVLSVPGQPLPPEMSRLIVATLHGCYVHWYASDRSEPIAGFLAPARTLFSDWLRARAG